MSKEKVYMVCDYSDDVAKSMSGCPNIGVEHMGTCHGRILKEDGTLISGYTSSTMGWLKSDLTGMLENPESYEIIDLLNEQTPEIFKQKESNNV